MRTTILVTLLGLAMWSGIANAQINLNLARMGTSAPAQTLLFGSIDTPARIVAVLFGDGSRQVWQVGDGLMEPFEVLLYHEYNCPGDYTIQVSWFDGINSTVQYWDVSVATPTPIPLQPDINDSAVTLRMSDYYKGVRSDRATIDWGDGTALEAFTWVCDPMPCTGPTHVYANAGEYDIVVTNEYVSAECAMSQGVCTTVTVEIATPVEETTWGRVKALYR